MSATSSKRACASPTAAASKSSKLAEGLKTPAGHPHVAASMQPTASRRLVVLDTSAGEIECATMSNDGGQNPCLDEMRSVVVKALAVRLRERFSSASASKLWAGRTGERTVAYGEPRCATSDIPTIIPAAPPDAGASFSLTEAQVTVVRTVADGGPRCVGSRARRGGSRAGLADLADSFESTPHVGVRPCVTYLCAQTGAGTRVMATLGALHFLVNHRSTLHDQLAVWSSHDGEPSVHVRMCP